MDGGSDQEISGDLGDWSDPVGIGSPPIQARTLALSSICWAGKKRELWDLALEMAMSS